MGCDVTGRELRAHLSLSLSAVYSPAAGQQQQDIAKCGGGTRVGALQLSFNALVILNEAGVGLDECL